MDSPSKTAGAATGATAARIPMLGTEAQIDSLAARGVAFDRMGRTETAAYLERESNLLHASAYRHLFPKHLSGPSEGKYINLDFADLAGLDRLDRQLRAAFFAASCEVERSAKVRILDMAAKRGEDGHVLTADYLASLSHQRRNSIVGAMRARGGEAGFDLYAGALIRKHGGDMPVWAFLEVIELGTLLDVMLFCADRWGDSETRELHYMLKKVKAVRNATGHGNCVINGFTRSEASTVALSDSVREALGAVGIRNSKSRKRKLRNARVQQLVTTLVVFRGCHACPSTASAARGLLALSSSLHDTASRYGAELEFRSYLEFLATAIDRLVGEMAQ